MVLPDSLLSKPSRFTAVVQLLTVFIFMTMVHVLVCSVAKHSIRFPPDPEQYPHVAGIRLDSHSVPRKAKLIILSDLHRA